MRATAGSLAAVLFAVILYLFFVESTLSFTDSPVKVECASVAAAGWPEASRLDTEGIQHIVDVVPSPLAGDEHALPGILRDCDERRTTYTGFMALIAVPTVLLGVLAIWLPKKKRKAVPRLRQDLATD